MGTSEIEITDCLKACGVATDVQERILDCARKGRTGNELCLLGQQRAVLLDALHLAQRRIDLMDLLISSLK